MREVSKGEGSEGAGPEGRVQLAGRQLEFQNNTLNINGIVEKPGQKMNYFLNHTFMTA